MLIQQTGREDVRHTAVKVQVHLSCTEFIDERKGLAMRLAQMRRRLYGALRSRGDKVRRHCTEASGAVRAWFDSAKPSDRVQTRLYQFTVEVAATTTAELLVWMLTRGR
ncbi:hypothetical protein ACF1AY_15915 [Streptomyces sp. NPDC014776]|uniref:hypothetical protein n=1 Tax=unclassified Streptomyces TaxID=2593676 RepID=UPI003700B146